MDTIWSFISSIMSAILPSVLKKKEQSEFEKQCESLRFDVARALTMHARYYCNPVDLADTEDNKLPQKYDMASNELRSLGAKASALAAIFPTEQNNLHINKNALSEVSGYLIGLSNSMTTPYNCGISSSHIYYVKEWERKIKELLELDD